MTQALRTSMRERPVRTAEHLCPVHDVFTDIQGERTLADYRRTVRPAPVSHRNLRPHQRRPR